jgi:hypothetical protein
MKDRKITHEVKLQKSVIIILAVLAIGVMANAFAPALEVRPALAEYLKGGIEIQHSGHIQTYARSTMPN